MFPSLVAWFILTQSLNIWNNMQLRKYKISNVASRTRKSENQRRSRRKFSCSHLIEEWFLYFPLSWCRFVLCESGFWTKCPLQREKCRARGHKSVRISVIARARKREFISVISLCVSPEDWLLYSSKCQTTSDYYYSAAKCVGKKLQTMAQYSPAFRMDIFLSTCQIWMETNFNISIILPSWTAMS